MVITKQKVQAASKRAAKRMMLAADEMLVEAGRAAKRRQRRRAVKAAAKAVGRFALIAGATAATSLAARAMVRRGARQKAVKPGKRG